MVVVPDGSETKPRSLPGSVRRPRRHSFDGRAGAWRPRLMPLADLSERVNSEINGREGKSQAPNFSDFEHKYFNINFEVLQTDPAPSGDLLQFRRGERPHVKFWLILVSDHW